MPRPKTVTLEDSPAPVELPPPGPNIYTFRKGDGGGRIEWSQRGYSYTIDPQADQVVITVALRPAE